MTDKPVLKVPSKLKECVRTAREEVEKRLREEQKLVNSFLFRMVTCYMAGAINGGWVGRAIHEAVLWRERGVRAALIGFVFLVNP